MLFDGKTPDGWRGYKMEKMPAGWRVIDGALVRVAGGASTHEISGASSGRRSASSTASNRCGRSGCPAPP